MRLHRTILVSVLSFLLIACFSLPLIAESKNDEPHLSISLAPSDSPELAASSDSNQSSGNPGSERSQRAQVILSGPPRLSLPLAWMPIDTFSVPKVATEVKIRPVPLKGTFRDPKERDPIVQDSPFSTDISVEPAIPSTDQNFSGVSFTGWYPPDTNGDVGPGHFVQTVNVSYGVFTKLGAKLSQNSIGSIFSGQSPCSGNYGDPIVLHDQLADRWMISQFTTTSPYYQCVAVSQTSNPTGAYYLYQFFWSSTDLNDYPHFGVWPDGYYVSVNEFQNGASFVGAGVAAFERSKMLLGQSAQMVVFHRQNTISSLLPSDLDGSSLPPANAPNYYARRNGSTGIQIWKFAVNWASPASSTFTNSANLAVTSASSASSVPQPGTTTLLDSLSDRLMFRLAYRNFGSYESLVVTHSVSNSGIAGIRWYEIRNPGGTASVFQQGTYAPADGVHRWMGSAAMDASGNIGVGYSVSNSSSVFPGIRYTGRLTSDPLNQLPQGEATIVSGGGSQTGVNRWGDYSAMTIDPADDCTFWFTTEYQASTASVDWRTRIASFKFPGCGGPSCPSPSGLSNNTAADLDPCADTGVRITWSASPADWGDSGTGTRTYEVLRDGVSIASGLAFGTTSFTDTTAPNSTSFNYTVRYINGCGSSNSTSGASAKDDTAGGATIEAATQSGTLQAKNNIVSTALAPAFTIASGASSANISWTLGGNTDLTTCVAIRLRAPGGTEFTLKNTGQANPGSANVLSFYQAQGAGTYSLVLQELSGCGQANRNANISASQMVVQMSGSCGGNTPPIASFTLNCSALICNFTDTSTDPGGSIASRSWQFGDGGISTSQNPTHTYGSSGTYSVTLTVTDNGSLQDSDTQNVAVSSGGGGFTLTTTGYKIRGNQTVDLVWSGAVSSQVDIFRNGAKIITTTNDSAHTDNIGVKGAGTYIYKVCEAGTSTCSNDSTVVF